jgi:hypothetical protein
MPKILVSIAGNYRQASFEAEIMRSLAETGTDGPQAPQKLVSLFPVGSRASTEFFVGRAGEDCPDAICPRCRSTHVKKSESANSRLVFPLSLFMVWVRCHNCGRKFRRFGLLPGRHISDATAECPKTSTKSAF